MKSRLAFDDGVALGGLVRFVRRAMPATSALATDVPAGPPCAAADAVADQLLRLIAEELEVAVSEGCERCVP